MKSTILLRMDDSDLGKMLDDLRKRQKSWRKTADCFRSAKKADNSIAIDK